MVELTRGRLYIDEDPDQSLASLLTAFEHDSVSTTALGNKGRSDAWQLAFAAGEQRSIVTCNIRDFIMLHEAWTTWSRKWGIGDAVPHAGILLIPQSPQIPIQDIAVAIDQLIRTKHERSNRLFRWRIPSGWQEL